MNKLVMLCSVTALLACAPNEEEGEEGEEGETFGMPCESATISAGIVGEILDTMCEDDQPLCWSSLSDDSLRVYDSDPVASGTLPGEVSVKLNLEPVRIFGTEGPYSVELGPGTYYMCRFLGDDVFNCSAAIELTDDDPLGRADFTRDPPDSAWTSGLCP